VAAAGRWQAVRDALWVPNADFARRRLLSVLKDLPSRFTRVKAEGYLLTDVECESGNHCHGWALWWPGLSLIDIRQLAVGTHFDRSGRLVVHDAWPEGEGKLEVQLTDVIRVNALAVPAKTSLRYRVLRNEPRMLLSFLSDRPGRSLAMRTGDFMASAGHVKRFITESFGMGMLTAAVQSHYGWESASAVSPISMFSSQRWPNCIPHPVCARICYSTSTKGGPVASGWEARGVQRGA
jgi:hypothetical protein